MKRLMMLVLAALLSLGVASVSLAQEGQPAASATPHAGKTKKHTKKHAKKSGKKGKKKQTPAAGEGMQ